MPRVAQSLVAEAEPSLAAAQSLMAGVGRLLVAAAQPLQALYYRHRLCSLYGTMTSTSNGLRVSLRTLVAHAPRKVLFRKKSLTSRLRGQAVHCPAGSGRGFRSLRSWSVCVVF